MNVLLWLAFGSGLGWLANLMMKTGASRDFALNVAFGIAGALFGGLMLSPIVGVVDVGMYDISLPALFVSMLGSSLLLAVMNVFRSAFSQ